MRKLKIILFAVVSTIILGFFGFEVLAAVFVNINVNGKIRYSTTNVGAQILGVKNGQQSTDAGYLNFTTTNSNSVTTPNENDIFTFNGGEQDEAKITATNADLTFAQYEQRSIYLFVKNIGDLSIIPNFVIAEVSGVTITTAAYYFDTETQDDPLAIKGNKSAPQFISAMNGKYPNACQMDIAIAPNDVMCLKVDFTKNGTISNDASYNIDIWLRADIVYNSNNILRVYQDTNAADKTKWTKKGFNATLHAEATKIDKNTLGELAGILENNLAGNQARDDYHDAPVYRKIDLVNIDIETGEILGRLSDKNYPFEWYGRPVTLNGEVHNYVDVYTYYPTMYVRRWVEDGKINLAVSEKDFSNAVKVDEYYLATFEATLFSPVYYGNELQYYDLKKIGGNFVPRSYVNDGAPLTNGSINYLLTNYPDKYKNTDNFSDVSTTQQQMMAWTNNLNTAWGNDRELNAQGQNWKQYVWNILYLIKYADNNSQAQVGSGNTMSYYRYGSNYPAERGGATIGVYNANTAGAYGYNSVNMAYGSQSSQVTNGRTGLYTNQFLTVNDTDKNYLLDGYVGSDGYTSVFCLGKCNPWGNVWEWIFGTAVIYDGTNLNAYIQFNDWDGSNWHFANDGNVASLTDKGYQQLGYDLPTTSGYYNYLGVDNTNSELSLIGMQTSTDTAGANGLTDYYYCNPTTGYTFGVLLGGSVIDDTGAGAFFFIVNNLLAGVGWISVFVRHCQSDNNKFTIT